MAPSTSIFLQWIGYSAWRVCVAYWRGCVWHFGGGGCSTYAPLDLDGCVSSFNNRRLWYSECRKVEDKTSKFELLLSVPCPDLNPVTFASDTSFLSSATSSFKETPWTKKVWWWLSEWPEKNRQMSIKVAQNWFHYKNDRFWHLYNNSLRMWEIWANWLLPMALKSGPKSNKSPNLVTLYISKAPFDCPYKAATNLMNALLM